MCISTCIDSFLQVVLLRTINQEVDVSILIGLIGEARAGKGTFTRTLSNELAYASVTTDQVHTGSFLSWMTREWGQVDSRENMQKVVIAMRHCFGDDALTHAMKERIASSSAQVVTYDSVRLDSDLRMVRSHPKHILVYVTAPASLRWERAVHAREKVGEGALSFEEFREGESAETEWLIPQYGESCAHVRIDNTGTLRQFEIKVRAFIEESVLPKVEW